MGQAESGELAMISLFLESSVENLQSPLSNRLLEDFDAGQLVESYSNTFTVIRLDSMLPFDLDGVCFLFVEAFVESSGSQDYPGAS